MKENDEERDAAIAHHNKFSHGNIGGSHAVSGGNGGTPVVSGGDGASHSPYVQGGGGAPPVYAAGAANNNHHPHHGGGNRDEGRTGLQTLAMTTFAWFLL